MPDHQKAVGHERQNPVAPWRADGQQFHRRDVRAEARLQALEPLDVTDVARALRAFENDRGVVFAIQLVAEARMQHGFGPSAEEIDVGGIVHGIDGPCPGRSGCDFAEYRFALGGAVPLHVRETRLKAERLEHGAAHVPSAREMIGLHVAQHHGLRTDPLFLPCGQRAGPVYADVPEGDFAVDAYRVKRVFLRINELFDIHLPHLAGARENRIELEPRVHAKRIGRSGARDRLYDHREADLLGRALALGGSRGALVFRRPDPRGYHRPLHRILVTEQRRLRDVLAGHAEPLTQACGEDDARLPQALHLLQRLGCFPLLYRLHDRRLIEQRGHLQIPGEVPADQIRQVALRLIADAEYPRPLNRQAAGEVVDLRRIPR